MRNLSWSEHQTAADESARLEGNGLPGLQTGRRVVADVQCRRGFCGVRVGGQDLDDAEINIGSATVIRHCDHLGVHPLGVVDLRD